jgi:hypothetical protein
MLAVIVGGALIVLGRALASVVVLILCGLFLVVCRSLFLFLFHLPLGREPTTHL